LEGALRAKAGENQCLARNQKQRQTAQKFLSPGPFVVGAFTLALFNAAMTLRRMTTGRILLLVLAPPPWCHSKVTLPEEI
jgi:hypothetical protein